jgi:hypothetical protein
MLCGQEEIAWEFVALAAKWLWYAPDRERERVLKEDHGFYQANFMRCKTLPTCSDAPFPYLLD